MMLHLRHGQRAAEDLGRVLLRAQGGEAIPEDTPREGAQSHRRLMVASSLDPLEHVEQFVRRYRSDRALGYPAEQIEEPARLLDDGRCAPFALHLLDVLLSDQREGRLRRQLSLKPLLPLYLRRIDPVVQLALGLVALPTRLGQGHLGKLPSGSFRSIPQQR